MAGGPSTPALAIAVCEAGGLGFLAAGYKRADALRDEIHAVRAATAAPFGVNLFVPSPEPADGSRLRVYLQHLKPEAERQGAELGEPGSMTTTGRPSSRCSTRSGRRWRRSRSAARTNRS